VSRDITSLGLVKVDGAYRRARPSLRPAADPDEQRIAEGLLAVDPAGEALVVIHTPPGEANRVAVALDRLAWPELLGTIAGDDTIFVAVRDGRALRAFVRRLKRLGA
jgi:transcriptional regulator of arginine metabolism